MKNPSITCINKHYSDSCNTSKARDDISFDLNLMFHVTVEICISLKEFVQQKIDSRVFIRRKLLIINFYKLEKYFIQDLSPINDISVTKLQ